MTAKLLTPLREQKIPVVGFVNEKKLYKTGEVDDRIKALNMWLDSGFELGNHTFSHASLNRVGLKAWEEDVIQGETVTRMLLSQHNLKLRYFRHPYLDTGRDLQTRREAEAFLVDRGYRIAPVTLDAWDWMYAGVYDDARKRGDTALQQQLLSSYLSYTSFVYERGVRVFGKAIQRSDRLRTKTDSASAWQLAGSRPHQRTARCDPQARISLHYLGRCIERSGLQLTRRLHR